MSTLQAVIIAIVEGITEFLPISSTGHMVITSSIMGIRDEAFTKTFEIAIQLGAILAVVGLYWRKFFDFTKWKFYIKLIVAVIPALILGLLFSKKIVALLDSPTVVPISMLVGGILLLFIVTIFKVPTINEEENIYYGRAFIIVFVL